MLFVFLFFFLGLSSFFFFFFNDTATTEIYTLSLHDALPISAARYGTASGSSTRRTNWPPRSEEHTSELQSHSDLVCRLLLEKKKKNILNNLHKKKKKQKTKKQTPEQKK